MLIRDALAAIPDVIAFNLRAGQVLVYPRHIPPGVFVVLSGALRRFGDPKDVIEPMVVGPFAVPGTDELTAPAQSGIGAVTDAAVLFIPRSVLLRDECIAKLLVSAGMATVTLQSNDRRAG